MRGITGVALFLGGAVVGFLASNVLLKKQYEAIANEEIQSVKEHYKGVDERDGQMPEEVEIVEEVTEKEVDDFIKPYTPEEEEEEETIPLVKSDYEMDEETEAYLKKDVPYIIEPDRFGEGAFDYQLETIYYYTDGVLANSGDEVIEDWFRIIGDVDLSKFDMYDEDDDGLIYVRNDNNQHDYEISKERFSYVENMAGVGWD